MKAWRILYFFVCISLLFFVSGCSTTHFFQPPPLSPEAESWIAFIASNNRDLTMFKGLGKAEVTQSNNRQTFRLAWIGERPNHLRIGVLNLYGTPTITLAADGRYLYLLSHSTSRYYKTRDGNPGLSKVIHIPIYIKDVLELMCGRAPIGEYHSAVVSHPEEGRAVLLMKSRWGKNLHRVTFRIDEKQLVGYERFDSTGRSVFRATLGDYRDHEGNSIPHHIEIMNDEAHFSLQVERYWPHIKLPASAFVLQKPNV